MSAVFVSGESEKRVPLYRHHKPSGQAVVTVEGRDFYLGKHGTAVSREKYGLVIAQWAVKDKAPSECKSELTVVELINAYINHAKLYYRKNGRVTDEARLIAEALHMVRPLFGRTEAVEFGPVAFKKVRQAMIDAGWCRTHINRQCSRVKRMFRWAAEEELLPSSVYDNLRYIPDLKRGRSEARESEAVAPVSEMDFQTALPFLPAIVGDMVRLQRLLGCRPDEVCSIRPCDIDRTGGVWLYSPHEHKMEHLGRPRIIAIGPRGQDILRLYLLRAADSYCFSPAETDRILRAERRAIRKTYDSSGNVPGSNVKRKPKRKPGERYSRDAYRRAVHRACDKAGVARWSPNRLRHSAATEIRSRFGLEGAQAILGHRRADVTQIYAERDLKLAERIAREVG